MGLHNLLCRPFLFYLVMDNENTDSQSAVKGKESVTTVSYTHLTLPTKA